MEKDFLVCNLEAKRILNGSLNIVLITQVEKSKKMTQRE